MTDKELETKTDAEPAPTPEESAEELTGQGGAEAEVQEGAEEGAKEPTGADKAELKTPYTPEELEALLQTDEEIDTSRLSPEGKLLMKSFQRGYEKKFTLLADERKQLEASKEQPPNETEKLFQMYLQNPNGFEDAVDIEIDKLIAVSAFDEGYEQAQQKIRNYQKLVKSFARRRMEIQGEQTTQFQIEAALARVDPKIKETIPDMVRFAQEELGLDKSDINEFTANRHGVEKVVKRILAIRKLYDIANAGKTASRKQIRKSPVPLVKSSSTSEKTAPVPDSQLPIDEWMKREKQRQLAKIKRTLAM